METLDFTFLLFIPQLKVDFVDSFFHLQRLGEANDGVLCPTVNWRDGNALEASYGRHVHDNPAIATLVFPHNVQSQDRRMDDTFLSAGNEIIQIFKS